MKLKQSKKKLLLNKNSIARLSSQVMQDFRGGTIGGTGNCTNPHTYPPCDTFMNSCIPCYEVP